ncbi:AsmA family protein [Granulicella sp. dw_53]|uniref:AsmA family protein n=1 Tax=Granulicella sp. dw_53 TaxID=2719792 RepID=UPI001BD5D564|nr:AsmA family protein [Granulicella sp. dw_53]
MKNRLKIGLAVVALLIVVVLILPLFVDANLFRPMLETQLTAALGRQVKVGDLSLSVFSGSLVANELSIAGDPEFSPEPLLVAKQLKIGVDMRPLLFSRKLQVRSFEAQGPEIHLVRAADGRWNFSSLGRGGAGKTQIAGQPSAFPDLTVGVITIKEGRAVVESVPAHGKPMIYEHLNASIQQFSFAKAFPFTLSAGLPADGAITVAGSAGPLNQQDAATTALTAQVTAKHLDPVAAGFVDPAAGLSMLANVDAHAVSNGVTLTSQGTIHAERLVLLKGGSPAPKPVELSYNIVHTLKNNTGQVQDLAVKAGNVAAHVNGSYELAGEAPVMNLRLIAQALPIDDLQALLPSVGVKLPNGSVLRGGTLTTTLTITGSTKDSVIAGPVEVDNTHLAGFDLGSKMSGMAALGGVKTGDTTSIQTLRTNVRVTDAAVRADSIYALLPALGEVSGGGTVAPGGALNFSLNLKLSTTQGIGQAGVGMLTALSGVAGGAASTAAKNGIPVTVTGTTSNPVIMADVGKLLQKNAASILGGQLLGNGKNQKTVDAITSLFGRKK